jgi:hypothetical protein
MYHYQHQKNQMIALGRGPAGPGAASAGEESEPEGEEGEGDYTVYECPGLASVTPAHAHPKYSFSSIDG